jgi:magnesium transporter
MQARILVDGQLHISSDPKEIEAAVAAGQPVWIELEHQDAAADALLAGALQLHPLTIEDIWSDRPAPKAEAYPRYLYVIIHGIRSVKRAAARSSIALAELDIVIGPTFVVTHDPHGLTEAVRAELERGPRLLAKGPAWLAHALLDHAVDEYLPVIDDLDTEIEGLEDEVLRCAGTKAGPPVMRAILRFKRMLLDLRRVAVHQREILLRLSRGEFELIPADAMPFYRDVYDHFLRVSDLVESYRDLVTNALEAYLSVQSNRMNDIMKTLTLISTVMLPITFIAGVYGMNFEAMPELKWRWGYPTALGVMLVIVVLCLWWFWHKGWIGGGDPELPDENDPAR